MYSKIINGISSLDKEVMKKSSKRIDSLIKPIGSLGKLEDIAIQLFYTVYVFGDDCIDLRYKNADEFMTFFLDGYTNESSLDKNIVEKTENFLILREIILHIAIYKKWDLNNLNPWQKDYYLQSKKRLENSKPLVDLDKVI